MRTNVVKRKLNNGETVHGCFVKYPDASLTEFVAMQGWDFLVFDGEHGTLEAADIENLTRAAELRDATPIARVTANQAHLILRYLDRGVQGVHVPWVNTPEAVEQAVQSVKYRPRGVRGLAGARANDFGLGDSMLDYTAKANEETLVVIHVETTDAVDAVDEYLEIEGVDVLFIGPTDLSHSLGYPGVLDHPEVVEAMDRVAEAVAPSEKTLGIFAGAAVNARKWEDKGARYLCTGSDMFLKTGMTDYLSTVRGS